MHQAIPYRTWVPAAVDTSTAGADASVEKIVSNNAVVVLARRGCCMSHVLKLLLLGHGVNPAVFAVGEEEEPGIAGEIGRLAAASGEDGNDGSVHFPVVFVGGKMFGGLEEVMAAHISGELEPALKDAGALWL
ncbi:glutaredoxin-C9-like [Cucurbita pepo subsp. pepo]|uniref:glutaredoxin-C9-like n=1 Tax=Cucurbita pepo subsp. pepo TaxID=3664 RepID=UPI000C9D9E32|nr:glutaredoxin-C9-like [Cucurbita pepo subsp. pepo]